MDACKSWKFLMSTLLHGNFLTFFCRARAQRLQSSASVVSSIPVAGGIASNASLQCAAMGSVQVSSEAKHVTFVLRMTSLRLCAQEANHVAFAIFSWLRRPRPPIRMGSWQ